MERTLSKGTFVTSVDVSQSFSKVVKRMEGFVPITSESLVFEMEIS